MCSRYCISCISYTVLRNLYISISCSGIYAIASLCYRSSETQCFTIKKHKCRNNRHLAVTHFAIYGCYLTDLCLFCYSHGCGITGDNVTSASSTIASVLCTLCKCKIIIINVLLDYNMKPAYCQCKSNNKSSQNKIYFRRNCGTQCTLKQKC